MNNQNTPEMNIPRQSNPEASFPRQSNPEASFPRQNNPELESLRIEYQNRSSAWTRTK